MFLIFFICSLAETNRHPFDLPEAESELVSGYNVEYAAVGFALFFLAEYSNIIVMCILTNIFFLGGWSLAVFENTIPDTFLFFSEIIVLAIKTFFFMFVFILIRATIPRFRYDQLMRLG
jgi:NADH-quinone oxidoreductase subunit H